MPSSHKRHKGTHEDCGVASVNQGSLVATEEAPYNGIGFEYVKQILHFCESCDKVFKNAGMLSIHVKHRHNGLPPPTCSTCSKVFKTKTELGNHVLSKHTDKTSNMYIERRAKINSRVKKTYEKERPAVCTTCYKEFQTKGILKTHMYNHTDRESVEYKEYIGKKNAHRRAKYASDSELRARQLVRNALNHTLATKGVQRAGRTQEIVGCNWTELVAHLNKNPHGYFLGQKGITVDHIRCVASFILFKGPIQQRECNNFNNLQLMPKGENNSKGSYYNAEEYAKSTAGKAIALLIPGWEKEFPTNEVNSCEYSDSDDEEEDQEEE